jgi:hypothetical protein
VLDADITLIPTGEHGLAGSSLPPLGCRGAGLGRVILLWVATAAIFALLHEVAQALANPRPVTERRQELLLAPHRRLFPKPEA